MEPKVSRSLANFAAKFCNELGTSKTSVCSPLSAEIVLALLALGCRGWSRTELLQALDMADDDAIRSSFALLTSTLKSVKESTLNMANKIYLQKGATLKPGIKKDAKKVFGSDLEQLDFSERQAAAGVINQWVAQQTNNMITHAVSAETFKRDTCVLLINAIYFRGKWVYPFEKKFTCDREFHVNKETTIKVPQMYMYDIDYAYGCSKKLKAKLLRIPYRGGEASMVIVLPDEIEGLNKMLEKLAEGYDLMSDIKAMKRTKLNITIPKFKAEITIDLKEVLAKLGIQSVFDKGTSEIDMLTSNKRLFVSDAIQKAVIEVDEVGTEAAACTQVRFAYMCARREPITDFTADRPFLYLLTCHEIPIFIGVYAGSEYRAATCSAVRDANKTRQSWPTGFSCTSSHIKEFAEELAGRELLRSLREHEAHSTSNRLFQFLHTSHKIPHFNGVYEGSDAQTKTIKNGRCSNNDAKGNGCVVLLLPHKETLVANKVEPY